MANNNKKNRINGRSHTTTSHRLTSLTIGTFVPSANSAAADGSSADMILFFSSLWIEWTEEGRPCYFVGWCCELFFVRSVAAEDVVVDFFRSWKVWYCVLQCLISCFVAVAVCMLLFH